MTSYNHRKVEKKWQKMWEQKKLNQANDPSTRRGGLGARKKIYALVEFPYPSGEGLHVGHIRSYTAMDVIARKRRTEGYEVLYPMGWDAFGLPTENYAIKTGLPPQLITRRNTNRYRKQLQSLGFSFDWSREINTADPNYYRWTQWMFLQFFKRGLAYKAKAPINWCPKDKIGLANEEVVDGKCERCGTAVEQREKEQWMLAITKYADRLNRELDLVDYPESIKTQQRNWIGKGEGVVIKFKVQSEKFKEVEIFTTRPETIFGVTFIAVAGKYDRFTGNYAINPANQEKIPIWEAEYVMGEVGTGAVMGVPAHDQRDFVFAKKHNLPVADDRPLASSEEIIKKVGGRKTTTYKLRDWIFSRQRYWGEPIPIIHCQKCGMAPVSEKDLPVKLPPVKNYQPTNTGKSPLANIVNWVKVKCPKCGGEAERETDVMPNWAGSSWYYIAYIIKNIKANTYDLKAKSLLKYWLPVDWYNGGMEHTTLHLFYSRFWHKVLNDLKLAPGKESYQKRTSHGLILAHDGEKMSKSRGNVISPDDIVRRLGADTLRVYEMFMRPFGKAISWNKDGLVGARRFLERVWKLAQNARLTNGQAKRKTKNLESFLINQTIQKVSDDIEAMKFNTAISTLMILLNKLGKSPAVPIKIVKIFLKLLSPFAPHLADELWHQLGEKKSVHLAPWPRAGKQKLAEELATIVVQVNGRVRDSLTLPADSSEDTVTSAAKTRERVKIWLNNKLIQKTIFIPNRLINFVVDNKVK